MDTYAQIRKLKEEIQKLRNEYLRATGDAEEMERLKRRIEYHKRLLADLGGA